MGKKVGKGYSFKEQNLKEQVTKLTKQVTELKADIKTKDDKVTELTKQVTTLTKQNKQ